MSRNLTAVAAGVFVMWAANLPAVEIAVPNASFELPPTNFVSVGIDSWQKSPKPDWYDESTGGSWAEKTGVFKNPGTNRNDHIDNCDGSQAAWLFAVPEVGLLQDYNSLSGTNTTPTHAFNAAFDVGKSYALTIGIMGGGGGMPYGATLQIGLYYRDAASNVVTVASTSITNSAETFPNNTHLTDYSVEIPPVKPGDAWAGQYIGVQMMSTTDTNRQGGYWDVDNIRLSAALDPPNLTYAQAGFDLRISWPSALGYQYQVRTSEDLVSWSDYESPLSGTGGELTKLVTTAGRPEVFVGVVATPTP